jgi:cation transport protein ChaC
MTYLWEREMVTRAYSCRLVTLHIPAGPVRARAFIVNRNHQQYAGKLSVDRLIDLVCQGHGQRGPCRTYLENTVRHLDELGVPDKRLHELLKRVQAKSV